MLCGRPYHMMPELFEAVDQPLLHGLTRPIL